MQLPLMGRSKQCNELESMILTLNPRNITTFNTDT
jgi:hypothetical protein